MRILTGQLKGLEIPSPIGGETRPTSSRVREAVLSSLAPWIPGARVLDLFAGSGVMGLELISRGAQQVTFVDQRRSCCKGIEGAIQLARSRSGVEPFQVQVVCDDVQSAWARLPENSQFDIIWADPPYREAWDWAQKILILAPRYSEAEGVFLFESDKAVGQLIAKELAENLAKQKQYGDTVVSFFRFAGGMS